MEYKYIYIKFFSREYNKSFKLENKLNEPIDKFVRKYLETILNKDKYYSITKSLEYHNHYYYPCYNITEFDKSIILD